MNSTLIQEIIFFGIVIFLFILKIDKDKKIREWPALIIGAIAFFGFMWFLLWLTAGK